ncbi:MAG: hypothetical protein FRX49_00307 [Trebouxia sp. A1-2]|nr:MAG: hypothetical protein FRX49_00307 [Trebouxia sp. A1-2]
MSTPLEKLEQQYAAEVVKVDADEDLLKRLERGIRGLKGVTESTGGSQSAVDKTARKIAALEQLVGSQPPDFDDLDAFLYEEPTVKLPVANAKYCSLIADNEALMSKIEPESKSEAAALARVVTVALETEYEPVADELVLAGFVDALLWNVWRCMSKYDQGYNPGMSRKRNCGDDSATLKGKRPDLCVLSSRAMLFKGEDKTAESDLTLAVGELGNKMKHWGAAFHGKVQYILCYACAGSQFQMCAMQQEIPIAHTLGRPLSLARLEDRLQKRVLISPQWPEERTQLMKDVYAASCASPFLIHAVDPPCVSHSGKQYVVDLEPVGQPVFSKYGDRKPKLQVELKISIRCILQALVTLHQAGFAHTDLRRENILWHEGQYVLIDLEFACELNTCPFTPEGIPPASCSTLSPSHHFNNNQTELNSHLQSHTHRLWAKDLKKQTVYVVQ